MFNQNQNNKKESKMKRTLIVLITLGVMSLFFTNAVAGENLVQTVTNGCKVELEKYCKDVTPGEGRVLACLYAYGDKLSPKCEYALYDAAAQLERAVAALSYVANECDADLDKYCSAVAPGEGRLLNCLEKKSKQLTKRCKEALKDVGLK
jgi:Cysteine rich repeat